MRIHRIIVAALLIGTMTTQAGSQGAIPAVALGAAGDNPETFVGVLAKLRVPAGLEIRNEDRPVTYSVKFGAKDGSVVPLGDVVDAFNRMHGDYRANIVDGVVVVRPLTRRVEYLDIPATGVAIRARGVMNAARSLFGPLDPTLNAAGGQPGSVAGPVNGQASVDRGDDVVITVALRGQSVVEVLNEIAKLAPGHAWLAVTNDDKLHPAVRQVGFIHAPGIASQLPIQTRQP